MKWQAGQSGNPNGRKPGTGKVEKLRAALAKELPDVLESLVAQAKAGDVGAIKLILERTIPALRPVDAATSLPLSSDGGLAEQGRVVWAALATGQLPANQAASLLQGLGTLAKLVEMDELEKRIAALEGQQG